MSGNDWLQYAILIAALAITAPLLGVYMATVFSSEATGIDRIFEPFEKVIYRVCGIDPKGEQRWRTYALSVLAFSAVSVIVLYLMQRLQGHLPLNPGHVSGIAPPLAWNTAVSFLTNTNWQNYAGESTMSTLTQMAGLTVQNFVSAAVGITVAIALIRGLTRRRSSTLGSFWVDLTRTVVRILLPMAAIAAIVLSARHQGPAKVAALDAGADDYVTKPFGIEELLARIRALLRRGGAANDSSVVEAGTLLIDLAARRVQRSGQLVHLTPKEWSVLAMLVKRPGHLVSQAELLVSVWGPGYESEGEYLRTMMARIRRKLEEEPSAPRHFLTEPGVGYRFEL